MQERNIAEFNMSLDFESGYFFDLKMVCGGYAYYVTHTSYKTFTSTGREVRYPAPVNVRNFSEAAHFFGQHLHIIQAEEDYHNWLYKKGWAIVPENMVKSIMPQWLKSAECVKAATQIYTDVEIVSPSALKHYTGRMRKRHVFERDKNTCLACGAAEEDGVKLTMHHVRPFSRGGETTTHNLVTLCESCNERLGTEEVTELYEKAGLHFSYDHSIIAGRLTRKVRNKAIELSDNLMQTRCEIW